MKERSDDDGSPPQDGRRPLHRRGPHGPDPSGERSHLRVLPRDDDEATDPQSLLDRYEELEIARRRLEAEQAVLVAELHARKIPDRRCGHRTKAWLAMRAGSPGRIAARDMRVAGLLAKCDVLLEALHSGRISVHHVDAIARCTNDRNIESVIAIQQQLIDLIDTYTRFEPWEAQVRDLLRIADPDGGHDPRPEDNHLSVTSGPSGELLLRGTFVGQWAQTVQEVLDTIANRELHRFRRDHRATGGEIAVPGRSSLMAIAFAEACREAMSASAPKSAGTVADVTLVIHNDDPTQVATINGARIDNWTADLFKCDPVVHPVVINSLGIPTHLGRSVRLASPEQRRAMAIRDGGCVFPGCDAPHSWVDAHHVYHWERLGPTDLPYLASLCRHHHGVIHRDGWSMTPDGSGRFNIITPLGRRLISQQHGRLPEPDPTPEWDPTGSTPIRSAVGVSC